MRIQSINNITFGYNKQLNRDLISKLDNDVKTETELTDSIRSLNTFCNQTEDAVNKQINKDKPFDKQLFAMLLHSKVSLADIVEEKYPELNYVQREAESYLEEGTELFESKPNAFPFQYILANHLLKITEEDSNIKIIGVQIPQQQAQATKKTANAAEDIVELFTPNEYSPKGFKSIVGLQELKDSLYDKIIYPVENPEIAQMDLLEYGKRPPRGYMLYGPPGCGKTSIVEALSVESGLPLFKLKISKAGSKYIHETSNNYEKAFDYVAKCAQSIDAPCLLFIDELEGLTKGRNDGSSEETLKQMSTLLNLIETARPRNIIIIGATNKFDIVDEAIKRRFDEQIYVGMPDIEARKELLRKNLSERMKGIPLAQNAKAIEEIAIRTNGFPSSALVILTDKASDIARKDGRRSIKKEDFFTEIDKNATLKINENLYKSQKTSSRIGFSNN